MRDYTIVHDHATAHGSVSYYVDAGDPDFENHPESGRFAVLDPRRYSRPIPRLDDFSMTQFSMTQFTVRPRSGQLVIFPGWLQHYTSVSWHATADCDLVQCLGGSGTVPPIAFVGLGLPDKAGIGSHRNAKNTAEKGRVSPVHIKLYATSRPPITLLKGDFPHS